MDEEKEETPKEQLDEIFVLVRLLARACQESDFVGSVHISLNLCGADESRRSVNWVECTDDKDDREALLLSAKAVYDKIEHDFMLDYPNHDPSMTVGSQFHTTKREPKGKRNGDSKKQT